MTVPTLEPVEYRILENIRTTLAAISTTDPTTEFFNTIASVHVLDDAAEKPTSLNMPAVVILANGLEANYAEIIGTRAKLMRFDLYCLMTRQPSTWIRDIYRLASDIERALMVDAKRGATPDENANAFDTLFMESTVANLTDGNRVAMARVSVAIEFRSQVNDPTQQA